MQYMLCSSKSMHYVFHIFFPDFYGVHIGTVYSLSPRNYVAISNRNTAQNKTVSNITAVVILTYMRSGSSLTGDILQHSPNAFYVFEPLHAYSDTIAQSQPINLTYVNGSTR